MIVALVAVLDFLSFNYTVDPCSESVPPPVVVRKSSLLILRPEDRTRIQHIRGCSEDGQSTRRHPARPHTASQTNCNFTDPYSITVGVGTVVKHLQVPG
jgi:hypothetical protein